MPQAYDLLLAEYLQVWLHQLHLIDTRLHHSEKRVLAFFDQLAKAVDQLQANAHPSAPTLLAALQNLAVERVQHALPCTVLKQELNKVLYTALRRSVAVPVARTAASRAFSFSPPPEFAPRPTTADFANWT